MRAFLALPIDEPSVFELLRIQAGIPIGKPVPEGNLHLTLAFLGEVSEMVLEEIHDRLSAAQLTSAEVAFQGLGTFAEMQQGLVFVAVQNDPALVALQSKTTQIARAAGVDLPRRRFRPHVTLTRANRQPDGPARDKLAHALGQPVRVPGFTARQLALYQSEITHSGARHYVLETYPLF